MSSSQDIWALARECGALRSGSFDAVKEWSFTEVGLTTFCDRLLTQGYAEGRKDERDAALPFYVAALALLDDYDCHAEPKQVHPRCVEELRAAIAKATGGSL